MKYIKNVDDANDDNDEENEDKSFKEMFKSSVLVSISVILGCFVINQFKPEVEKLINEAPPLVFIDNPPF